MLHIYKASAGSGKTYNLTKQYLMLLLGKCSDNAGTVDPVTGRRNEPRWTLRRSPGGAHRHILAITFTNKATEEMIKRIIAELAILAGREPGVSKKSDYLKEFMATFNTDEATLSRLASETLDELLADYVYFNVSTIDAFFQNVLRTFAREIEMPDDFQLEINNSYAIATGVGDLLQSINSDVYPDPAGQQQAKWLGEWLGRYIDREFEDGKAVNLFSRASSLFSSLVTRFSAMMNETFKMNIGIITDYLAKTGNIDAFLHGIINEAAIARNRVIAKSQTAIQYGAFADSAKTLQKFVAACATGTIPNITTTVIAAIDNPDKRFTKTYRKSNPVPEDLDSLLVEICAMALNYKSISERNSVLLPAITSFGLLGCLLRVINDLCKERNLLLLSETNSLLRSIINDDDTPFVYERIGYYLRHFLIDEFQDTSAMQWENLRPLLMESLGYNHENLIIGDEKQCIYRFRNSDPELLGSQVAEDAIKAHNDENILRLEGNCVSENSNWRSSREVITFNNSIFRAISCLVGDVDTYDNVVQQINPNRKKIPQGYVKLIFQPKPEPKPNNKETEKDEGIAAEKVVENAPVSAAGAAGEEEQVKMENFGCKTAVEEVSRMLSGGYQPGDIAILVRTHGEGERIINALINAQSGPGWPHGEIEITSVDSLEVASSSAVRMVVEILRLSQEPDKVMNTHDELIDNAVYRRVRLTYLFEYFLHEPIVDNGTTRYPKRHEALSRAVELLEKVDAGTDLPADLPDSVMRMLDFSAESLFEAENPDNSGKEVATATLSTIVDRILSRYISTEVLSAETAYITAFQDIVYDFCSRGNSDIRSFLQWWDRSGRKTALDSADEGQAITVMTIHKSKGLEFPCVIIPFASWNFIRPVSGRPAYEWYTLSDRYFPDIAPGVVPPMIPLEFKPSLSEIDMFRDDNEVYARNRKVDALNLAYVAFTRAVNELIIVCPYKTGSDKGLEADNLYGYLRGAVGFMTSSRLSANADSRSASDTGEAGEASGEKNCEINPEELPWLLPLAQYSSDDGIYEVGTPTTMDDNKKSDAARADEQGRDKSNSKTVDIQRESNNKEAEPRKAPLASEERKLRAPVYNPKVNDRLNTFAIADIHTFSFDDPRNRGTFLHKILSRVRHSSDLPLQIARAATRARLTPEQTAIVTDVLTKAVSNPEAARWFDGFERAINERTIVSNGASYRPDRIVWLPDGSIEIVDYKFGKHKNKYFNDLRNYCELLELAGYSAPHAFLYYVPTLTIKRVR